MITADWALLVSIVAWVTRKVAVIEDRIGTLERTIDNDITGGSIAQQIVNDFAVI